ncbi:MAG: enoyl-CoA hydratase/isomerase family protein [Cyanobacteria bacterium]|nr:enoyl-CoA hydratase/isomerase family protein [Cyanobacteriota bacterium]
MKLMTLQAGNNTDRLNHEPMPTQALQNNKTRVAFQQQAASDHIQIRFGSAGTITPDSKFLANLRQNGILVGGGAGVMGSGIALNAMNNGIPAYIQEINADAAKAGQQKIVQEVGKAEARGILSTEQANASRERLKGGLGINPLDVLAHPQFVATFAALYPKEAPLSSGAGAAFNNFNRLTFEQMKRTIEKVGLPVQDMVPGLSQLPKNVGVAIEAIKEDLKLKQLQFYLLDQYLDKDAVLATNTSSLNVRDMAAAVSPERRKNFVGLHFFKPAHMNRFVEIVKGPDTSDATVGKMMAYVRALGKTSIVCQDSPGFVVNRIGIPMVNEGLKMLDEKQAGIDTIDQVAWETIWPNLSKKFPEVKKMVLLPFNGINQDNYMWILGETTQVLHRGLGDGYKATPLILEKNRRYSEIETQVRAESKQNNWSEAEYRKILNQRLDAIRFPIDQSPVEEDKKAAVRDRLLGLIFGIAGQLLDEGVTTAADVDRGVKTGLAWEKGPFELMGELGPQKSLALVEAYASKYNPAFKVPKSLQAQAKAGKPFELSPIDTRREGTTQVITINRPQPKMLNMLDRPTLNALLETYRKANADPSVQTIVFESVGGKYFVAGADIFKMQDEAMAIADKYAWVGKRLGQKAGQMVTQLMQYRNMSDFVRYGREVYDEIAASEKVTVAKINGTALGGGMELALACDYVVASDQAEMGLPEVKHGIFPAWGGTERMPRRIGKAMTKFLILEGGVMKGGSGPAILNAEEAYKVGLIDKVVPAIELDGATQSAVQQGEFSKKANRDGRGKVFAEGSYYDNKSWRYQTASLGELLDQELKSLYDPEADLSGYPEEGKKAIAEAMAKLRNTYIKVLKLASDRIDKPNEALPEKDMRAMAMNLAAIQGQEGKLKKLIKQYKAPKS